MGIRKRQIIAWAAVLVVVGSVIAYRAYTLMKQREQFSEGREKWDREQYPIFSKILAAQTDWSNSKVTVFKLDPGDKGSKQWWKPRNDGRYFHSWKIVARKQVSTDVGEALYQLLEDPETYGQYGSNCFWPGFGVRIANGEDVIDYLICLDCDWRYLYFRATRIEGRPLSEQGEAALLKFYNRFFAG